jgi:type III restriction enzyme
MSYLFEEINSAIKFGVKKEVPDFIYEGLSEKIKLRDYQIEALKYFLVYDEGTLQKNKQIWTLFHMATGSGKTVMIAALILYYYQKGYRHFLFFVRNINIIDKTIDNLTNPNSKKYLFRNPLQIEGSIIKVNRVLNFQGNDGDAINICFTSNAGLQNSLGLTPQENSLSINDFEDNKVVMIADESHHLNAKTKNGYYTFEEDEDKSWESTATRAFRANKDNVLLEFTATCDLNNSYVKSKYEKLIVYNYPLSKFREDKYSKEIMSLPSTEDMLQRVFIALVVSEYRYKLFLNNKYDIKPIVMLKSKTITESTRFYEEFLEFLKHEFDYRYLETIKEASQGTEIINKAFEYFESENVSLENLAEEIKIHFAEEHCIPLNSVKGRISKDEAMLLNSLEDQSNPYRLIFVVDMLNEGWDVLNLFDIVRLYNERQGAHGKKEKVSKYTISEAQLIGRGARYFPFKVAEHQIENKRKYDTNQDNDLRICETLIYHCTTDSRYITEIRTALREIGLMNPTEPKRVELKLKDSFKREHFYKSGVFFTNDRIEKDRRDINELPNRLKSIAIEHKVISESGSLIEMFGDDIIKSTKSKSVTYKVKDLPEHVKTKAIRLFAQLSFKNLKEKFPNLSSTIEFMNSDKYLGDMLINYDLSYSQKPSNRDLLGGLSKLLAEISKYVSKIQVDYYGTTSFKEHNFKQHFGDVTRFIEVSSVPNGGEGFSQNDSSVSSIMRLDLTDADWYAYCDNFGTTEEKKFVKFFSNIVQRLNQSYEKVFLVRNERQVGIYDFDTGDRFEPDYLLFLSNSENGSDIYYQIFIEPKGDHLLEKDAWKEEFLRSINEQRIEYQVFLNNDRYKIWGLPFFNENNRLNEFSKEFDKVINGEKNAK